MNKEVELLVHAGAPSNRKADDIYILQATNYLGFQNSRLARTDLSITTGRNHNLMPHDEVLDGSTDEPAIPNDPTVFLENTQSAYDLLESQVLSHSPDDEQIGASVDWGDKTPILSPHAHIEQARSNSHSESSQTSYLETPKVSETHVQSKHSTQRFPRAESDDPLLEDEIIVSQPGAESITHAEYDDESVSELPTSYSLSDSARTGSKNEVEVQATSPPQIPDPAAEVTLERDQTPVRIDQTPHSKLGQQNFGATGNPQPVAVQASTPFLALKHPVQQPLPLAIPQVDNPNLVSELARLPKTIRPPSPETSILSFSTHITPALKHLAELSQVADCYRPTHTSREISPLERGHWLVPCISWPVQVQLDFWQFLHSFLSSGGAGWGVWCTVEETFVGEAPTDEDGTIVGREASENGGFGPAKVYCWGEVVAHVYLLLYVASKSKVRKAGLRWVDGEGVTVVRMREG